MGQDQVQNQRFLLAGRTFGGRAVLFGVDHRQIAPVRAGQGPAGGGVTGPRGGQRAGQFGLDVGDLGAGGGHLLPLAGERQAGLGKGPLAPAVDLDLQGGEGRGAGLGHQGAGLGQPGLKRVEPGGVGDTPVLAGVGKQAHPLALGALIGLGVGRMARNGGEHQAVEEAPPLGRALQEQAVLGRRQPDLPQVVGQPAGRQGLAGDAHGAPRRAGQFHTGAELGFLPIGRDHG